MEMNQNQIKMYNEEEVKEILQSDERLVYVDNGSEEVVIKYEDLADIIVDINDKFGSTDLKVYDYKEPDMDNPLLTTFGPYLNKCDPNVRKDIIDRLIDLQTGNEDIKDYKVIDEDMLDDVLRELDDEMER
ncbi:MAG: hypothetical protein IJO43_02265 [Bacilli bacterium]|nr:hypothetical protein [Bacilli bacterium]